MSTSHIPSFILPCNLLQISAFWYTHIKQLDYRAFFLKHLLVKIQQILITLVFVAHLWLAQHLEALFLVFETNIVQPVIFMGKTSRIELKTVFFSEIITFASLWLIGLESKFIMKAHHRRANFCMFFLLKCWWGPHFHSTSFALHAELQFHNRLQQQWASTSENALY